MATDENTPKLEADDSRLHNWVKALYEDGLQRRLSVEGTWWENIAAYSGDLWAEWNPHDRKLEEGKKDEYKARLNVNLVQPVIRTELAKLTKNRPITDVTAVDDTQKSLNSAKVGDKMLNSYAEKKFHLPRTRRRMLQWVLQTGLGGIFVDHDETLDSEIDIFVDDQGAPVFDERVIEAYRAQKDRGNGPDLKKETIKEGDLVVRPLGPMQFMWDFSQIYIEDASWVLISEVYDVAEIRRRWDVTVDGEQDAMPAVIEQRMLARSDLSSRLSIEQSRSVDMAKVHRLFIKPGHYYFPDGAEIVFTDQEILKKTKFPHDHGELPLSVMGHIPLPVSQYQMSTIQQIKDVVLEISKTESQLIENRNLMANPPWVEAKQSRIEGEIRNKPGLRIKYNHVPNVPPPTPVQMPSMPSYVNDLLTLLKDHVLEISGQGETSQGRVPPGARSGVAIAYLQEEDDTRLGPTVTEYEETMERSNWQILELIAQYYTIPRTIRINRRHSAPEVFDFVGTMLEGVAGCEVQAGSALPRSKAAKQQFILDLWDRKLEQDPRKVREMLELSSGEPDEWELDIDQAERENRKLASGEPVEVKEWHNHPAHKYAHRRWMKSPEYEALSDQQKAVFEAHDQEHEAYEQAQAMEIQAMQAGVAGPVEPTADQEASVNGEPSTYFDAPANTVSNGMNNPGPQGAFAASGPRDLLSDGPA